MNLIKKYIIANPKLKFFLKNVLGRGLIKNYYGTTFDKNCLIMYLTVPFLLDNKDSYHQAFWQQREMAQFLSEKGYNIDVIDYNNDVVWLHKKYDLVIDLIPGKNNVYKKHMNPNCKTIAYLTGSNATFQNAAERKRLEDLEKRRGVRLLPRRQSPFLTKDIEKYTACFMIGNEYNWKTYDEFNLGKPHFIKNTGHVQAYSFDKTKKRKNAFLYFGSSGQVHKGLDLLLEIFSEPEMSCELFVCGNFKNEIDFEKEYHKELYECSNIHPVGHIDIESELFGELSAVCSFSILPSCSEANAGAVLTTMSAGLIPICSLECGFEDDEVIHLNNCSKECIRENILKYSNKDMDWISENSKKAYDIVNDRYSKEEFKRSIMEAFDSVL